MAKHYRTAEDAEVFCTETGSWERTSCYEGLEDCWGCDEEVWAKLAHNVTLDGERFANGYPVTE